MPSNEFAFPDDIQTALYDDDVNAVLAQISRHTLPAAPIAFYGSSSFRLWQNIATDLNSLDVVNLGFGGGTNASGLHYIDRLLTPLRPAKIVLYFGENDISNDGLSAKTSFENFRKLLEQITVSVPGVPVFFLSAKQSPTKWIYCDVIEEFNDLAEEYCDNHSSLTYVNVTDVLLGENGRPIGGYYISDGVHLNPAGYSRWAKVLHEQPNLLSQSAPFSTDN
jgi:lysophospholipase L1-like esterase